MCRVSAICACLNVTECWSGPFRFTRASVVHFEESQSKRHLSFQENPLFYVAIILTHECMTSKAT